MPKCASVGSDLSTTLSVPLASVAVAAENKQPLTRLLPAFDGLGEDSDFLTCFLGPVEVTVTADGEEEDEEGLLDLEEVRDLAGSCEEADESVDFLETELESEDPF